MTQPALLNDSAGRTILLGPPIGSGGEGAVYAVEGATALAAKVYHRLPLSVERLEKLAALIACRSPALDAVAAWPQSMLFDSRRREPCGILMPRIDNARPLHELYGTSSRRAQFPYAKWHHLALAARNVAAAFESMHAAGLVVGDVNQGNLLVDQEMCVRFIDCDSLQITRDGRTYPCPVGTPHFTPPELQSVKLSQAPRTAEQDRFGLAALVFHLLFVGRHPFAGRYFGAGELSIEKAIAERRFAFSRDRKSTLVEPPPASLLLDDLPGQLAALFESAFRSAEPANRPAGRQWAEQLESLIQQRKACPLDPAHVYFRQLKECPWCRIEDEGGPAFFVLGGSASAIPRERLDHLEDRLRRIKLPVFPHLSTQEIQVPRALAPKKLTRPPRYALADAAAFLLAASPAICLLSGVSAGFLLTGLAAAISGAAYLVLSDAGRSRRREVDELHARLEQAQVRLRRRADGVLTSHRRRQNSFEDSVSQLKAEYDHYRAAGTDLHDVLAIYRTMQKNRFLGEHLVENHFSSIPGLTRPLAAVLQSYGIESALDVDPLRLLGTPMVDEHLILELKHWREDVERRFASKPEHGVDVAAAALGGEAVVHRFRAQMVRRILMAARQLESVVAAARQQLATELAAFDADASEARALGAQLRTIQSSRRRLERSLNRTPGRIIALAAAGPAIGLVLRWFAG